MIQFGNVNQLICKQITDNGIVLDGLTFGDIFLPNSQCPDNIAIDQPVDVFVYQDMNDTIVATTTFPKAQVGEFASLQVKEVNKIGAFLDWGLSKDLLVPFNQQKQPMEVNKRYIVRVYLDARTQRIAASSKLDRYIDVWPADYADGEEVDILIAGKTDLGFKAIVNNNHWGLLYENEVFTHLHTGQKTKAYIKKMRDDGLVDLMLNRTGRAKVNDFADDLLGYLANNKGLCMINDKSSPEQIQRTFNVSKKTFKSTVGRLLKLGKIKLIDGGIEQVNN